ncbi:MAG: cytochrome [Actinomycetia bacterium]|nr:cytochrome [Actinomycetes bacterium]
MTSAPELKIHRSLVRGLKLFDADRLRWLDEATALGPLVALKMGPVKLWVVTDLEAARTILLTDSSSWTRPPALVTPIRVGVGENLFTQSEKAWTRLQPSVAPAFRKRALERRLADVDALVADEVQTLPHDTTIDLELAMGRIALTLAAWVLLGERLEPTRAEEIVYHQRQVVRWVGVQLGKVSGISPIVVGSKAREMRRHRAVLNNYADEVIARAKSAGTTRDDVLGALLDARPSMKALTPTRLRSHVLGLFLAGNETTAAALSWALVHGSLSPEQWTLVRDDPDRYTLPFLTETLRCTPAVWGVPRTPTKGGVTLTSRGHVARIRRGQVATVYLRGLNRDPNTWDDPLRFRPSRHDASAKQDQRALLPFGLGPRGCIGQHLAMGELTAVLPALARHGNITVDGSTTEDAGFALRVAGGLTGRFAPVTPANPDPQLSPTVA